MNAAVRREREKKRKCGKKKSGLAGKDLGGFLKMCLWGLKYDLYWPDEQGRFILVDYCCGKNCHVI